MTRSGAAGLTRIGEAADEVCLLPPGTRGGETQRLYRAARRLQGSPLTALAASRLKATVRPGEAVLLVTGAGAPPQLPAGETDGPLGVAVLARALHVGLGARPVVASEERNLDPLQAVLGAIGVECTVLPLPCDGEEAGYRLIEELRPAALISVEKLGPNPKGVIHDMRGRDVSAHHAPVRALFDGARDRRLLTVAVGDRGNEVGFGVLVGPHVRPQIRTERCRCPCRGRIGCDVRVDVLVVSAVSNWGAYGVVTCLQALTGRRLLHTPHEEAAMIRAAIGAGARDGVTHAAGFTVDGIDLNVQQAVVTLLGAVGREIEVERSC
ncbi:MAG TPA: glutamate cyclase domain-containing protein [Candidatus Methylomirabilis sp.]|nr:glutamate cyclase domain-containing protein [Candidatus Methylomirabilis sp.]